MKSSAGIDAESLAARWLEARGLELVGRNHHSRFGEIDLIMNDGATLVFVEVRLRRSRAFGGAAASIDYRKQRKLLLAARHYLGRLRHEPRCRFDAILLDAIHPDRVEWLRDVIG